MILLKKHITIAVGYFFIVALMGILLRSFFVFPVPLNYKYLLHAHSHTALLGWIYVALTTIIYKLFLSGTVKNQLYKRLFLFTNITIVGMLLTFPVQGYALYSIIFSTLFLFASYGFTWFVIKNTPEKRKQRYSYRFIKLALFFLVLSSIGPWAIGAVMSTLGTQSIWYSNSIYFYLHFQYNGWFVTALLAIFFNILESKNIVFHKKKADLFYILFFCGTMMTVFLSFLWSKPPMVVYFLGGFGAVVQLGAFYFLWKLIVRRTDRNVLFDAKPLLLLKIAGINLLFKLLLQTLSAIPYFATLAFEMRDLVIGYLHLVLLGIVTPSILAFLHYFKLLNVSRKFILIFFSTFVITEILIFYKGIAVWGSLPLFNDYFTILLCASLGFPISVGMLLIASIKPELKNPL